MKILDVRVTVVAAVLISVCLVGTHSDAKSLTKVRDIKNNPKGYANEVVTLEGFATQWVAAKATTTSFYFLKDDWGSIIKVRTSKEQPEVGERYRVTGPVGIDPTNRNDVYVSEETRIHVRLEPEAVAVVPDSVVQPVEVPETTPQEIEPELGGFAGLSYGTWILIGAIVVVVFLLVFLLVWLMRSQKEPAEDISTPASTPTPQSEAGTGPAPEPKVVEGRTIKMHAPPPGTLKILPGRLEVTAGDDTVKELRFYRVRGQSTPEITFGRATGPAYTHIQLKPMTVSSRQAKMTYINNQWILTNFAPDTSNPTRYNGADLPVDGQTALKQGDRVEMGEVVLVFHES